MFKAIIKEKRLFERIKKSSVLLQLRYGGTCNLVYNLFLYILELKVSQKILKKIMQK